MRNILKQAGCRKVSAGAGLAVGIAAVLALSACRGNQYLDRRDTVRFGAGEANAHNRAVQMVDPWPKYSKNRNLSVDGKRMMVGVTRYQDNRSLEPVGANTSEVVEETDGPPAGPPPASQ